MKELLSRAQRIGELKIKGNAMSFLWFLSFLFFSFSWWRKWRCLFDFVRRWVLVHQHCKVFQDLDASTVTFSVFTGKIIIQSKDRLLSCSVCGALLTGAASGAGRRAVSAGRRARLSAAALHPARRPASPARAGGGPAGKDRPLSQCLVPPWAGTCEWCFLILSPLFDRLRTASGPARLKA